MAENESAYTEGEAAVDVGGKSYLPTDLEIDPAGAVTLPEGAAFTDLEHTLVTDYPDEHPERSVAFIQYTYDGRKAGGRLFNTERSAGTGYRTGITGRDTARNR